MPITGTDMLSAGTSLVGGLVNGLFQSKANKKALEAQQAENQKNRDFSLDMWNRNNEYNTITNQMQRFKDAGVNPHLAYQNGSPMNTSNAPASNPGGSVNPSTNIGFDANMILQSRLLGAQIDNINADTDKKNAETRNTKISGDSADLDLQNKVNLIIQENDLRDIQIKAGNAQLNLTNEQVKKVSEEINNLVTTNEKIRAEIDKLVADKGYTDQQKANLIMAVSVMQAQIKNYEAQTANIKAQTKTESYRQANIIASTSNIEANTKIATERAKSENRANFVGEKYDLSDRENNSRQNARNYQQSEENLKGSKLSNALKQADVDMIDVRQAYEIINGGIGVLQNTKSLLNPLNAKPTPTTTTTEHFDRNGRSRGFVVSRRE